MNSDVCSDYQGISISAQEKESVLMKRAEDFLSQIFLIPETVQLLA